MNAGLGANIGAGVDAFVGGTRTIYRRGGSPRFTVAPLIRRDGTAVRVQFSW